MLVLVPRAPMQAAAVLTIVQGEGTAGRDLGYDPVHTGTENIFHTSRQSFAPSSAFTARIQLH